MRALIFANSRSRLVHTLYIHIVSTLIIRVDYDDASSGFGLWTKTLRGQLSSQGIGTCLLTIDMVGTGYGAL